jgi:hypothetical protein
VALGSGSASPASAPAVTTHYVGSGCAVLTEHDAEWVTDRVGEDSEARLALTRLSVADAGEILTLQRAACVTEDKLPGEVTTVRLFTGEHSAANLRLYQRLGFQLTGRTLPTGRDVANLTAARDQPAGKTSRSGDGPRPLPA